MMVNYKKAVEITLITIGKMEKTYQEIKKKNLWNIPKKRYKRKEGELNKEK